MHEVSLATTKNEVREVLILPLSECEFLLKREASFQCAKYDSRHYRLYDGCLEEGFFIELLVRVLGLIPEEHVIECIGPSIHCLQAREHGRERYGERPEDP